MQTMQLERDWATTTGVLVGALPRPVSAAADPEVARWLEQAFAAERAPQARPTARPTRGPAAPAVRRFYVVMLALSLGTLLATLA